MSDEDGFCLLARRPVTPAAFMLLRHVLVTVANDRKAKLAHVVEDSAAARILSAPCYRHYSKMSLILVRNDVPSMYSGEDIE